MNNNFISLVIVLIIKNKMLINCKEVNSPPLVRQRYPQSTLNQSPYKSIDQSAKKGLQSADNNTSQFRQTMQMKRYKYQKMAYQSKPVSIHSFYDHYFAVEAKKSQLYQSSICDEKVDNECLNKVLPISTSNWISNTKKMQSRWFTGKKGKSIDSRMRREKRLEFDFNNQIVMNDIKQYFYSMKQYLNNHKKKVEIQRKIHVINKNQTKRQFQEKDNLSIIRLKPHADQKSRNQLSNQKKRKLLNRDSSMLSSPSEIMQNHSNIQREASFSVKSQTGERLKKIQTPIFQRTSIKKEDYHFIFGKFKENMTDQQAQKLKTLYYRDFIWKIWFNQGFAYESSQEVYKYYVGKGNNSRLIRSIMNRRTWWVQQTKQENAHFVWTQLKVYQIYKSQKIGGQAYSFNQKEAFGLTNTQNTEKKQDKNGYYMQYQKGDKNGYILNKQKYENWRKYIKSRGGQQRKPKQDMKHRNLMPKLQIKPMNYKITNHLQFSRVVGNKKALYRTMEAFFSYKKTQSYLPTTFHITGGLEDEEYLTFLRQFYKKSKEGLNCWIVKPGQLSNRGKDIKYCRNLKEIKDSIKQKKTNINGSLRTYIVQLYIQRPFLYQNRKFDLRHYLMITSTAGQIRGYFYQQGYVRTTSYPYSLDSYQPAVHLTNDAIQKYLPQYGKFQKANKLSYQQLNQYMLKQNSKKGFYDCIFPQLKKIGTDIIHASFPFIDPQRRINNFQIFGIDVMIDCNYQCWLIQVNANPCIQVNCSVLANVIPQMLDNALVIGLDANICHPQGKVKLPYNNYLEDNKFELVFDEAVDGYEILKTYKQLKIDIGNFGDDDDNYQSCEQQDYQS